MSRADGVRIVVIFLFRTPKCTNLPSARRLFIFIYLFAWLLLFLKTRKFELSSLSSGGAGDVGKLLFVKSIGSAVRDAKHKIESMMIKFIRPRLITFDVTGTLLMTKLEEHYVDIGSQHGLSVDAGKLARSFKNSFHKLSVEHPIYGKHTGIGWENWWRKIVHRVFKDQHSYVSDATLDKVANSLIRCYGTSMCWHKYPGTIELLEYLRKKGLIIGVISNFDERLEAILEDTRIRFYFSFVLTSYDFGMEKPHTSIFDEALRLTKERHSIDVAPQEAIHIGDSVSNDYNGAKNANWNALLIKRDNDVTGDKEIPAENIFRNLEDLRLYFSTLLNSDAKRI